MDVASFVYLYVLLQSLFVVTHVIGRTGTWAKARTACKCEFREKGIDFCLLLGAFRLSCSISVLSLLTKTSGFGVTFFLTKLCYH